MARSHASDVRARPRRLVGAWPLVPQALGRHPLVLDGGGVLGTGVRGRPWDDRDLGLVRHGGSVSFRSPALTGVAELLGGAGWPASSPSGPARSHWCSTGTSGRPGGASRGSSWFLPPTSWRSSSSRVCRPATPPARSQARLRADPVLSVGSRHRDDGRGEHASALSLRPPVVTPCQDLGQYRRRAHDRGHVLEPGLPRRALPERRRGGDLARSLARPVDTVVVRHMAPAEPPTLKKGDALLRRSRLTFGIDAEPPFSSHDQAREVAPVGRVSQWAVRRPWRALLTWVRIMVAVGFLGVRFGGDYNDNFELAGHRVDHRTGPARRRDRRRRRHWCRPRGPGRLALGVRSGHRLRCGGDDDRAAHGALDAPGRDLRHHPVRRPAGYRLPGAGDHPGRRDRQWRRGLVDPEQPELSPEAEGAQAHFGQAGVSPDGTVAYATVQSRGCPSSDLNTEHVVAALDPIKEQNGADGLEVGANGDLRLRRRRAAVVGVASA